MGGRARPAGFADRSSDACQSSQGQELPELLRAGEGDEEQEHDDHEVEDNRDGDHDAAREAVCELARWEREQEQRQKLGEPDQPEIERRAVDRVDLPADGDDDHLAAEACRQQRNPEKRVVPVPESFRQAMPEPVVALRGWCQATSMPRR